MTERFLAAGLPRGFLRAAGALAAVLALGGCPAPTETVTSGKAELALASGERIVVYPAFGCLSDALAGHAGAPSRVLPTTEFQDALYPWFEPGRAPVSAEALDWLLGKQHVRARIDELHVRYLVGITRKDASDGFPGFFCGAGYNGGGCLGVVWENKETSLDAVIWDLREGRQAGGLSAQTSGTSLAIGVAVPIIFVAYTEAEACEKMAALIAGNLSFAGGR